jgi:hypothetical protein
MPSSQILEMKFVAVTVANLCVLPMLAAAILGIGQSSKN